MSATRREILDALTRAEFEEGIYDKGLPTCADPAKFLEELKELYQSLPRQHREAVKDAIKEGGLDGRQ